MTKNFEENISTLEAIVKKLESGECGLDESIELYSKGLTVSAECKKQLQTAKKKIEDLSKYTGEENA